MIIEVLNPTSLHRRDSERQRELVAQVAAQLGGPLEKRIWRVEFEIFGNYFKANGEPRRRDGDNVAYAMSNIIAKAGGIDDCWLNRNYSVHVQQSDVERVVVRLS